MKTRLHKRISRSIRGHFRSKILAKQGVGVVARSKNGLLAVDPGDFNVSRKLLEHGQYDWPEVVLLSQFVDAASRIVFVGAHVGALLVPIVRSAGSSCVVAYEPSPRNHELLQMNLKLNELQGITVKNAAVGTASGIVRFTENRINTGNSRVAQTGEIEVPVVTLDDSLPPEWSTIELMVMDVEGFEVHAMRGGVHTLAKTKRLYVEFAPEQLDEQGSTVEEFIQLAETHFVSAYTVGSSTRFLPPGEFPNFLRALPQRRGLLLNLLFTRETECDPKMMIGS